MISDYPKLNPDNVHYNCSLYQLHYDAARPIAQTRSERILKQKYRFYKIPSLLRYYPKTMPSQTEGLEIRQGLCALGFEIDRTRPVGFWNMPQNSKMWQGFSVAALRQFRPYGAVWLTPPSTDLIIAQCFFEGMHVYQIEGNSLWLIKDITKLKDLKLPPLPMAQRIHIVRPFDCYIDGCDLANDMEAEGRQITVVDSDFYTNAVS